MDILTQREQARRSLLKALAAGAGISGISSWMRYAVAADNAFEGKTFRFGTYGGAWRDGLEKWVSSKLRARGGNVEYVLDSPTGNVAKLVAARGRATPFDAMEASNDVIPGMIRAGFLQKISYDRVPNSQNLLPLTRSEYSVMTFALLDGIVYNTEKFKENGIEPPKRYSDLINPKLAGRIAFPDVSHTQHWNAVAGLATDAGGDVSTLDKAIPLVNKMAPSYFYSSTTDLITKFGSGAVWVAPWSAGPAMRLKRSGVPVAIAYQQIGKHFGAMGPSNFVIMAKQNVLDLTEYFLNVFLSPEVQYEIGRANGSLPVNGAARERLKNEPEIRDFLLFSDAELGNLYRTDFSKFDLQQWRDTWNRQVRR